MNRQQFTNALFTRAKDAGFDACEVYYSASDSFSVEVFKGEIIKYEVSESLGLGFRGLCGGKMGYASTQILDEEAIDLLVDGAKSNALLIENEDKQFLHPGDASYAKLSIYNPALAEISASDKIAMARELENLALAADPRIEQAESCCVMSFTNEVAIVNTLGLNVSTKANMIGGYVGPTARDGDKVGSGFASFFTLNPAEIDLKAVATEAVEKAVAGLDAVQIDSGAMRVMFAPEAATDLLETFSGIFSADAAQKGLSLLKGREGEIIAAECVTLLDDPHRAGSIASQPFDGEGVATSVKKVVENGRLTTLLHNLKTAHKQNVATTGNAARSYASTVGISPSNFYFQPSNLGPDEMLTRLGSGLVITEIEGLHAGANAVSGDFSLSARGYAVRDGRKAEQVKQITVAGNFFNLLMNIEAVGSDLKFGLPSVGQFGSPSLLIKELSIAGK